MRLPSAGIKKRPLTLTGATGLAGIKTPFTATLPSSFTHQAKQRPLTMKTTGSLLKLMFKAIWAVLSTPTVLTTCQVASTFMLTSSWSNLQVAALRHKSQQAASMTRLFQRMKSKTTHPTSRLHGNSCHQESSSDQSQLHHPLPNLQPLQLTLLASVTATWTCRPLPTQTEWLINYLKVNLNTSVWF